METSPIIVEVYRGSRGVSPFEDWLDSLSDRRAAAKIVVRIGRVRLGNFGDYKSIGEGVYEFRIHFGPGYRIYFGMHGRQMIILLAGGDKSTQDKDIRLACDLWAEHGRCKNAN